MTRIDPVTLEIISNRLRFISKEMIITLTRIAYSSVIYDGHDCSAGLFDGKGQLLTLDAGIPFHISPMPFTLKAVLREYKGDINPGDIFITNDPSYGGTHLPDVLIIMPIFYKGTLVFFAAARGHWTDVGGSTPGSLSGKATELIQEGITIPPLKLFEKGNLNKKIAELIFSNMRMSEISFGDMMSQTAACRHAERACLEMIDKYGIEMTERCGEEIIARTQDTLRRKIMELRDGIYRYEDYLDNDGATHEARRIKVAVTVKNGSIFVDFTGSSAQSGGPFNSPISVTHGATVIAVKIIIDPKGVPNEGLFRLINVNAPLGTVVNPNRGAPTGGFTEAGYRIVFSIIGALAKAMPNHVSGSDYGTVNHTFISGIDDATGKFFIQYEYPPGGNGGTFSMDGPSAMRGPISGNTFLQSMELVESLCPLYTSYATLRPDSGGPGKFRGGLGLQRQVEILCREGQLSIVTDRSAIPPFGVYGGLSGLAQKWSVLSNGTEKFIPFNGKTSKYKLKKGDIVNCLIAGGGGYGDPLDRDPEKVKEDVIEGYISMKAASTVYGVVLRKKDLSVDKRATSELRKTLNEKKRYFTLESCGAPLFVKGVRGVIVDRKEEKTLGAGDLVEIRHDASPVPYRARVVLKSNVKPKHVLVDDEVMEMMEVASGDSVQIIPIASRK